MLGRLHLSEVAATVAEVCVQRVDPDGLVFAPETLTTEPITEAAEYEGVRVRLRAFLGTARVTLQLDVGFGDAFTEAPVDYPSLLGLPEPRLRGYRRESSVAEKFEAMTKLGRLNSRMKDFYDVWFLSRQFDFEGARLAGAITQTFAARGTALQARPDALTSAFAADESKVAQWRAFVRKGRIEGVPTAFGEVVAAVAAFLGPVATALAAGRPFGSRWTPPGGWRDDP